MPRVGPVSPLVHPGLWGVLHELVGTQAVVAMAAAVTSILNSHTQPDKGMWACPGAKPPPLRVELREGWPRSLLTS